MSNGAVTEAVVGGSKKNGVNKRAFLGPRGISAVSTRVSYESWDNSTYVSVEITTGKDTLFMYDRKELAKLVKYIQAALDVNLSGDK